MSKISKLQWFTTVAVGHIVNFLTVEGFDFVLYPLVIASFGLVKGAVIMWILSFLACYGTIVFYNWSKRDWLGIEAAKEALGGKASSRLVRMLAWANKRGRLAILLVLSIMTDPFICTVYMREEAHDYSKMDGRDWVVFFSSFIVSNLWWTIVVFTGLSVTQWVWKAISALH